MRWLHAVGLIVGLSMQPILSSAAGVAQPMKAGITLAGLDFGYVNPGRLNVDYVQPTRGELEYYHSKGLDLVRLPVRWERLQQNLFASQPDTAIDEAYLTLIKQVIRWAGQLNMTVIVDLQDYGGYGSHKLGDGALTPQMFRLFWNALARRLAGMPGLGGYDIMEEPSELPDPACWPVAAQEAVNAIRQADTSSTIYVEGYFYASAADWVNYNANLSIKDTAANLVYQAHVYGDRDASGTHIDWNTEAQYGVTIYTLAERVGVFASWCKLRAVRCMIGEVGEANNDLHWLQQLSIGLAAMRSLGMESFIYWAGGPWWGSFPMSVEPTAAADAVQMPYIAAYGAAQQRALAGK